jgi:trk system potassium uptake protein TrkH
MVCQRVRLTLHIVGSFLKYFALVYVIPLVVAIHYGELNPQNGQPNWLIYLYSLVLTLGVGLILELAFKTTREIERADGFTIVAFTWLLIPIFGTLPYLFLGLGFADAFFESMSGFTTTGATILKVVEELPRSALLWRSLTQWLGGMGVITLFIAVLPRLAVGGSQLFDREFPGALPERIRPRFSTTARLLWTIYVGLTVAQIVLLCVAARLPLFDSACVSLCTLPTGGFTPTTASIAAYANPVAEWIIIVFMFLAGMNFIIHYQVLRGNWKAIKNEEFRLYFTIAGLRYLQGGNIPGSLYHDDYRLCYRRFRFVAVWRQNCSFGPNVHRCLRWLHRRGHKSSADPDSCKAYGRHDETRYLA